MCEGVGVWVWHISGGAQEAREDVGASAAGVTGDGAICKRSISAQEPSPQVHGCLFYSPPPPEHSVLDSPVLKGLQTPS